MSLLDSPFIRFLIAPSALVLICVSQSYWFMRTWRFASRAKVSLFQVLSRTLCVASLGLLVLALYPSFSFSTRRRPDWRDMALSGLWISSALFAYLSVKFVALAAWLWDQAPRSLSALKR